MDFNIKNVGVSYVGRCNSDIRLDIYKLKSDCNIQLPDKRGFRNCAYVQINNNKVKLFTNGSIQFVLNFKKYYEHDENEQINQILNTIKKIIFENTGYKIEYELKILLLNVFINSNLEINTGLKKFILNNIKCLVLGKQSFILSCSRNINSIKDCINESSKLLDDYIIKNFYTVTI